MTSFTRLPRTQLLVGISMAILIAELFANEILLGDEGDASVGGWVGLSLFGIALSAVLVLVVVPRLRGENRRTAVLGFGIGAVVTCAVSWSALPFALGAAALAAAAPEDDTPEGEGPAPSSAGVILAVLAIIAAFILCLVG
ncbi:MAG: hypothetical protein M3O90_06280 [Actinomycetota bacterium]|nr:hypothetical protein [Actinomycetota bacterium]